jgi:zinc-ribbon domain
MSVPKFCPECGAPTKGAKFCPECGHKLADESAQSVAAPTPLPPPPDLFGDLAPTPAAPAPLFAEPATSQPVIAPTLVPPPTPTPVAAPVAPPQPVTAPPPAAAALSETTEDENDEVEGEEAEEEGTEESETVDTATPAKPGTPRKAVTVSTKVKVDATAEPYAAGQCTLTLALTLQPDDGHPEGRPVVVGVRSHAEAPLLMMGRLKTLQLSEPLLTLVRDYEAKLPALGAECAAKKQVAAEAAKAKQAAEAVRKTTTAKTATKAKTNVTPPATTAASAKPAKAAAPMAELF